MKVEIKNTIKETLINNKHKNSLLTFSWSFHSQKAPITTGITVSPSRILPEFQGSPVPITWYVPWKTDPL